MSELNKENVIKDICMVHDGSKTPFGMPIIEVNFYRDNKEKLLNIADKHGQKEIIAKKYRDWIDAYSKYGISLIKDTNSLAGSISALETKKIDPYMAGGAAHAIGGVFAGAGTVLQMESRNQKIDANRQYWNQKVIETNETKRVAGEEFELITKSLGDEFSKFEEVYYLKKEYLDSVFSHAMQLYRNKDYDSAKEEFLLLGSYNNASSYAKNAKMIKRKLE